MTMNKLRTFFDNLEEGVMACLLAFMTCLTFIQVVLRYVFNSGWVWSLEATTYAFGWLVLIGMSYGVRTRAHIAVDLAVKKFPDRLHYYISLLAVVICLVYSALMIYGSSVYISNLYELNNMARDIHLPKWVLTGIMPLAFVLLAIRFLQTGWRILKGQDRHLGPDGGETAVNLMDNPRGNSGK